MYADPQLMYADPTVTPEGPRSLHFRGNCPIPRLPELASSCARPQAAALRDLEEALHDVGGWTASVDEVEVDVLQAMPREPVSVVHLIVQSNYHGNASLLEIRNVFLRSEDL